MSDPTIPERITQQEWADLARLNHKVAAHWRAEDDPWLAEPAERAEGIARIAKHVADFLNEPPSADKPQERSDDA